MGWTEEQLKAITIEGGNVLISAGAGSEKTAVLTERVKRKLLEGIHIDELLILTFTNAAAHEMKSRIRKTIKKTPSLKEEEKRIDHSFITTFDSFALSVVKKYHTKLNVSGNIQITDQMIVDMKTKALMDQILEEYYENPSPLFLQFIHDYCLKGDEELKKYLLGIYQKIYLKYDKKDFLEKYSVSYDSYLQEYLDYLFQKQKDFKEMIDELSHYFEEDFVLKVKNNFETLLKAKTYDDFSIVSFSSITVPRGSSEEGKRLKKEIWLLANEIKEMCSYSSLDEMKKELEATRPYIELILEILRLLDQRLEKITLKEEIYTFTDIQRMAIQVVMENDDVREELKNQFQEIMIDEYQDTSDTQEKFVSMISSNNVYMVGDVKQSIYRFRNANPDLFKEKYQLYERGENGTKIDLTKNFRSRQEVLEDINQLFCLFMDQRLGGADYQKSHQMIFGNENYLGVGNIKEDSHLSVLSYSKDELKNVSKDEEEAYLVGLDIQKKVESSYPVFDMVTSQIRPCTYQDFVILLEKGKAFSTYQKVFESLNIPLTALKEESFQGEEDILVIRNLFRFLICIKEECFDKEFEYCFVSIARSFLWDISDEEIFHFVKTGTISESDLFYKCLHLIEKIDEMSAAEFFLLVLDDFNYEERVLTIGDVRSHLVRVEYLYHYCLEFQEKGNTIYDFVLFLNQILEEDYDLRFNISKRNQNTCQIMTIHKSKGLEFPICYYAGFSSKFNIQELKEKILYDSHYGFVLPKVDGFYKDTILKSLLKKKVKEEEISEKIRLLYVALTRAREKMILVTPTIEEQGEYRHFVPDYVREKYSSFLSILQSVFSHISHRINETSFYLSKDYRLQKEKELSFVESKDSLEVKELMVDTTILEEKHYSKEEIHEIDEKERDLLSFGTKVHAILEEIDFQDYDLNLYSIDSHMKEKIEAFLHSDFMKKRLLYPMYKEYEFVEESGSISHGIIDLLIEEEDHLTIVDYKLKNIDDSAYDKQLNGYRAFIHKKTGKDVQCFLYSILDEAYREINYEE